MSELRRRRWMRAPVGPVPARELDRAILRPSCPRDDEPLVGLLDASYVGTIDFDPDADHRAELDTWRTHDEADDRASVLAVVDGELVGACLIGRELGSPLLYEIVVSEAHRGSGIARAMLARSLSVLDVRGEELLSAWVTDGNVASEALLLTAGFTRVTPPVARQVAIGYYRAAQVAARFELPGRAVVAASSNESGATLWIVDEDGPSDTVLIGEVRVRIERLAVDDPQVAEIAATAMPIHGASWLLSQRRTAPHDPGDG